MFEILEKDNLAPQVFRYLVKAPEIANKAEAGQFVIIRLDEKGERIPITVCNADREKGTLVFFVQAVGKTSIEMSLMQVGEFILDIVGPLGNASEIEQFGTVILVGGGFGIAAIHPIARAMRDAGNKTISILGARTKELILLENEMRKVSSEVRIVTDDGSCGSKGFVTDALLEMIQNKEPIHRVIAIGPLVMMKAVADLTRQYEIQTFASLNPIMIDGTGMCGACRVTVGNEMKFACVDGPEFDAHQVDFEGLLNRLGTYVPEEKEAKERYLKDTVRPCQLEAVSRI